MGMLERAELRAGERVLVTGASGGVGLALVALAAARGCRVVAVTSGDKVEAVGAAGAVTPRIAASYDLRELPRAQRRFLERDHVGKIVITL
jgi:NADPH:quinone reductase-like Zn-dependent oxidoreductase